MKKALALLVTIIFILAMGVIAQRILQIVERAQSTFAYEIGEDRLLINSAKRLLQKVDIHNGDDIDRVLLSPMEFNVEDFKLHVHFFNLQDRFNLNNLFKNGKINQAFYFFLQDFLTRKDVENVDFFLDLLLDTLDTDLQPRSQGSEIGLKYPFNQGAIESWNQFFALLRYYVQMTGDNSVFDIDWKQYFTLYGIYVDCDRFNESLAKMIGIENVTCEEVNGLFSEADRKALQIFPFDPKKGYIVRVEMEYEKYGEHNISLLYDLVNKRVIDIEKSVVY